MAKVNNTKLEISAQDFIDLSVDEIKALQEERRLSIQRGCR